MSADATKLRTAVVARVLDGPGTTPPAQRRAAFDNTGVEESARALVDKITKTAWKVTDEDVAAAKVAGLSEDAIFELAVAAAIRDHAARRYVRVRGRATSGVRRRSEDAPDPRLQALT